jgi:hypothetical protein
MVFVRNMGRARLSGVEIEQLGGGTSTAVFRIEAGRVASLAVYWERSRALADLGLEQ